jgi:hypothetical protein
MLTFFCLYAILQCIISYGTLFNYFLSEQRNLTILVHVKPIGQVNDV